MLLFWIVSWTHRITWLQGPLEPALAAGVAYLMVQPGPTAWKWTLVPATWSTCVTLRLLQVHWWLLVAAGVLSQLASLTWWRGEAVWWLASAGRSNLLATDLLRDNATLTNVLTHGVVLIQLLALWLVTVRPARSLGIVLGIGVSLIYGCIADQILYALLLASFLTAYASQEINDSRSSAPA